MRQPHVSSSGRRSWGLALVLGLALSGSASAAIDAFLYIDGRRGPSSHQGQQGWFEVELPTWSGEPPSGPGSLTIHTRAEDRARLGLSGLGTSSHMLLSVPRAPGSREYQTWRLEKVRITSIQAAGTHRESLTFNYEEIKQDYIGKQSAARPEAGGRRLSGGGKPQEAPDEDRPIQDPLPPQLAQPIPQPDLLPLPPGLMVATTLIPWGTEAAISSDDASSKQDGRCRLRYRYDAGNQGQAAAGKATNRIRLDAPSGLPIAQDPLPALAPGAKHTVSGLLDLPEGTSTLYVHVDDDKVVAESNEQNNLQRVLVRVEGSCG